MGWLECFISFHIYIYILINLNLLVFLFWYLLSYVDIKSWKQFKFQNLKHFYLFYLFHLLFRIFCNLSFFGRELKFLIKKNFFFFLQNLLMVLFVASVIINIFR